MNFESRAKRAEYSSDLSRGRGNYFDVLGLIEPWKADVRLLG